MCGILGLVDQRNSDVAADCAAMSNALQHRGPDDSGVWCDRELGIALGFRRLAILDLTTEGHQPMCSRAERYVIVFNGEIYNHLELRSELESLGHIFRGRSDTEVMLQSFEQWGIEASLRKFVGMFAAAIWDRKNRTLSLTRDRLGEKPLYYGWSAGIFSFSSELGALKQHRRFHAQINRDALALLMQYSYIPAPHSIYQGFFKLPAATLIELPISVLYSKPENFSPISNQPNSLSPRNYWSLNDVVARSRRAPCSDQDALAQLESKLLQSIRGQIIADVPVGAFLSGGIDSSTVVALMQQVSHGNVRTYSIGFEEESFNEAGYAREVARHLGTDHTEMFVSSNDALKLIPELPSIYTEPFADPSQIPTTLLSRLTRQNITVALSGDGADELFGGYSRYSAANNIWKCLRIFPRIARRSLKGLFDLLPDHLLNQAYHLARPASNFDDAASRIRRLFANFDATDRYKFYAGLLSFWSEPNKLVLASHPAPTALSQIVDRGNYVNGRIEYLEWLMYADTDSYLPDDILTKVDRASMSASLETRAPFLDHRVVEFVWSLALDQRIRANRAKWLLRQLLHKYVPDTLVDRPKMGFGVPIAQWLRGPLRTWADELLDRSRLQREGYFDSQLIWERWQLHLSGKANFEFPIWNVLMFQQWLASQ